MSAGSLYVAAIASSVAAALLGLPGWLRESPFLLRLGRMAGGLALALATAAFVLRWLEAGHLPLFGTYESALSLALACLLVGAIWDLLGRGRVSLLPWGALAAAGLLGHGLAFDPTPYALTISERSWVVDIHAVCAWLAFGALTINAGLSLATILVRRLVPDAERLVSFSLSIGFLLHSAMMASGSFYKFLLFGKAWSFDPIETLGFAAWVAYGTLLHMDLLARWNARRLAPWCLGVFFLLLVSYRGIVYFPSWSTYHIFDMNLRIHVMEGGS
jgi:ABC-type transport system involved in cytochrome c biogenesis permease subunit